MATIHKRRLRSGETVWELTHGTGTDRQRFVAGRTREEAQEVLNQFTRQLALHGQAPTVDSVEAVMGAYTQYLKTNRRPRTVTRYLRVLKTFHELFLIPYAPDVQRLRQLRPTHVEEYKRRRLEGTIAVEPPSANAAAREQELRLDKHKRTSRLNPKDKAKFGWLGRHGVKRCVSQRTINYELRVLYTFFAWAIRHNHLFLNPAAPVERFRLPKRALPKFMTAEELKAFMAACTDDERRLFMTILLSGMRKGEVEHLTWDDVSFELGVIFIQEKPDLGWKPKSDERLIPVSPLLHDILRKQYESRRSDRFVFANEEGNRDTHLLEKLKRICRQAGIRIHTVHALRHSFGAHLRMAGVSLADIGDLLGHRDLATTQIYAKVHQEHLRKAVSKLTPLIPNHQRTQSDQRLLPNSSPSSEDTEP